MLQKMISTINVFVNKHLVVKRYIMYCIIGFTGLALDIAIFNILIFYFGISPYISNIISMFLSINNNFFLNTYFNFKKKDKLLRRWILFCLIGITGILVSDLLLKLLYEVVGFDINLAKLITIPIIATLQFSLHKLITYK